MNRTLRIACFAVVALLGAAPVAHGQFQVTTGLTLEEYVNDVLLGSGVQAFNITLTGSNSQLGHLTGGADSFAVDAGLVLSSDLSDNIDCAGAGFCADCLGYGFSDPDLLNIANSVPGMIGQGFSVSGVTDGCVLEFDFIAAGDTVRFNYVFGSDEYPAATYNAGSDTWSYAGGWVNTAYNDIFGFFLSGPGITGPYDSPAGFPGGSVNIAGVPGTDPTLPITISSVNQLLNSSLFVPVDGGGNGEPPCINGYTIPLTAEYPVQCGETYHIKLAIADGTDTALESIVVLEAGSFESNAVVQVDLSIDVGGPDANTIYEDCGTAVLTFERPIITNLAIQEMVYLNYTGSTAINGVDFGQPQPNGTLLPLPDSVVFAPGVQEVTFTLVAAIDGVTEGPEVVILEIENIAACNGGGLTTYFEFTVAENPPPFVVSGFDGSMCAGTELLVSPTVTGGYGNYTYSWVCNGATTEEILIAPSNDFDCMVIVGDTCGMPSQTVNIHVDVLTFPPLDADISPNAVTLECNGMASLTASASGGDGMYEYAWTDEEGNALQSSWWNPSALDLYTWNGADEVHLFVIDGCGFVSEDSVPVTYNIPPILVNVDQTVEALCNSPFVIQASATGQAPFNFTWLNGGQVLGWTQNLAYTSSADLALTLNVTDGCGQIESVPVAVDITSPPVVVSLPQNLEGPCTEVFNLPVTVSSGSGGYVYTWTQDGSPLPGGASIAVQSFFDTDLSVTVTDGCGESTTASTSIAIVNPPLVIDLGEDIYASCIDETAILPDILSGAGGYSYSWTVDGVAAGTAPELELQSFVTVPVEVAIADGCGGSAVDQLTYHIPDIPVALTVSPDATICAGDGISLSALATGGEEGFVYEWTSLGAMGPDIYITPSQTATYPVQVSDICGRTVEDAITVAVQYLFSGFQVSVNDEGAHQFWAAPTPPEPFPGAYIYAWDFGDGSTSDAENPVHLYDGLNSYTATLGVTSDIGCTDTAYTLIQGPALFYVPTAFSPNNDGINDAFRVFGAQIESFELTVFDRWSNIAFTTTSLDEVWTGNVRGGDHYAPNGIYHWVATVKAFGTEAEERSGFVQLIR
jgi:gliding motility-associated-like protein